MTQTVPDISPLMPMHLCIKTRCLLYILILPYFSALNTCNIMNWKLALYTQWTQYAIMASLWRQSDVVTSFWRHNDVIFASHRQNKPSAQSPQPTRSQTGKSEEVEFGPNLTWWAYQAISLLSRPGTLSVGGLISPLFSPAFDSTFD